MQRAGLRVTSLLVTLLLVVGCSSVSSEVRSLQKVTRATTTPVVATVVPTETALPAAAVVPATAAATPAPSPTNATFAGAAPSPTSSGQTLKAAGTATPSADEIQNAIKAVIEKGNHEQELSFAKNDPSPMRDTSTDQYYAQLVEINKQMASSGVAAIKLLTIEWGPVTFQSTAPSQLTGAATTFETWQTDYSDGSTDQSRDRNVYALVFSTGTWLINEDQHPDSGLNQPAPGSAQPTPAVSPVPPQALVPTGRGGSQNWSGYSVSGGKFTTVTGTWTIPEPSSTAPYATGATWVGIGGVRTHDLIQAGTQETVLGSGQTHYSTWIEMLPDTSQTVALRVHPGDSVTVSISQQKGDNWQISFKNNTTGQTYQDTVVYKSSLSSAEWIEEAPSSSRNRELPLENFGTLNFSAATTVKDGKSVNLTQAGARPVTMVDSSDQPLARPSQLGADGSSFSITRTEVPAPAVPSRGPRGRATGTPTP